MAKKAFVISAILVVIIVIVSIIISLINLKPLTYKTFVVYDSNMNIIQEVPVAASSQVTNYDYSINPGVSLINTLFKYEGIIMISSMIIIIIFSLLFYGAKRSKS